MPKVLALGVCCVAEVMKLARTLLTDLVRPYLPGEPVPVRGIYFDKRPGTNWLVAWHQDLTLALKERSEVPGWGPWSVKDGVPHVQPPVDVWSKCSPCVCTLKMPMLTTAR